jgi:arabinose-5-phosphate isomerase
MSAVMKLNIVPIQQVDPETVHPLRHAAEALLRLADALPTDKSFKDALNLILGLKGRVVVTGVGKSGHVGKKIAATLASTGTPAFYVHPTEAEHGDLGMITLEDAILALSHSGESKELATILSYATRFDIPVIALTSRPESTLGKASDIVLNTRVQEEACPHNLAPTTSTTAAMALADTLAIALMDARGFDKQHFAVFHPAGKLGAQLLTVKDVMRTDNLPVLPENANMSDTLVTLTQSNLGSVGFVDGDGAFVGIFTDGDLKRRLSPDLLSKQAEDVMGRNPKTISADVFATVAVAKMQENRISCLWVVDEAKKPVGLIRLEECLQRGVI